jgi:uncharacterized protein YndB with AHSA1/START domain
MNPVTPPGLVEATVSHRFTASAERVFDAWLDPAMARVWMQQPFPGLGRLDVRRVEIDARVGGKFTFSDMRAEGEAVHWGYYREIDRPRRLVFAWFTSEEDERTETSVVTLTITPLPGGGCEATIVHQMNAKWAEYVPQTEKGWGSMLRQIDAAYQQ